jgi:demethylmenaquinone methyltransferase/2-methoxy-6-polyprenyl-1,4-benzoquinol methylase
VDPSENMLAIGRTKVAAAGFTPSVVRLLFGDAQDLSTALPDNSTFDAITMAFAIRNVPERGRALQQLANRLRPGGRLAILELQPPSFAPARWFVRHAVPALGALMSGGAWREYRHLERSVLHFDGEELARLIQAAGLRLRPVETMNFGSVGLYVADKPLTR